MEIVLECPAQNAREGKLDKVDEATKGDLNDVDGKDSGAPFLVGVIEMHIVVLIHCGDTECEAGYDDGQG